MSTCRMGASRLAMTWLICSKVFVSATMTRLCVTGSTEMFAVPTVPLLLYWLAAAGAAAEAAAAADRSRRRQSRRRRGRRHRRRVACAWS